jgi:hypothetical protein
MWPYSSEVGTGRDTPTQEYGHIYALSKAGFQAGSAFTDPATVTSDEKVVNSFLDNPSIKANTKSRQRLFKFG